MLIRINAALCQARRLESEGLKIVLQLGLHDAHSVWWQISFQDQCAVPPQLFHHAPLGGVRSTREGDARITRPETITPVGPLEPAASGQLKWISLEGQTARIRA